MDGTLFDMFSSENLSSISEVLLWKEYNLSIGYTHDAGYILSAGGDQLGLSRSYITSFLMQNGLLGMLIIPVIREIQPYLWKNRDVTSACSSS